MIGREEIAEVILRLAESPLSAAEDFLGLGVDPDAAALVIGSLVSRYLNAKIPDGVGYVPIARVQLVACEIAGAALLVGLSLGRGS